jgi:hypothetical protein
MSLTAGRRIPVHPGDPGIGEEASQFPLHLLGPQSELPQVEAAAVRAAIRRLALVLAVVTPHDTSAPVESEGDVTGGAAEEIPTVAAVDGGGIPAPVQEQQNLFSAVEALADPGLQDPGQDEALLRVLRLPAKIDHGNLR